MNSNVNIFKNSLILYVRLIISSIISLFASRIILNELGVSSFGLYSVVGGVVVIINFLRPVLLTTTNRYLSLALGGGDLKKANKVFNISLIINLGLGVLFLIFAEIFGVTFILKYLNVEEAFLKDAVFIFRVLEVSTFFTIISIPHYSLITATEAFFVRATIAIIRSLLQLVAVGLVVIYIGNKLEFYSILMGVVVSIPPILFFTYCKAKYKEIVKWNFCTSLNDYKAQMGFSGWILLGGLASLGHTNGSALIINSFFGTILNASFGVASQVKSMLVTLTKNISQAAIPQIFKRYSKGNVDKSIDLVCFVTKTSFFMMFLFVWPIYIESNSLLKLWLKSVPPYTELFVKIMMINALIETLSVGLPTFIQAVGNIKWFQIIGSSILITSLPLGYLFYYLGYEPYSILIVFGGALTLNHVVSLALLKFLSNFNIENFFIRVHLRVALVVLLMVPTIYIKELIAESIYRPLLTSVAVLTILILVIIFVGLEKHERVTILHFIRNSVLPKLF